MIAQIELAMLARVKAVADAGGTGFAWRTLTTYPDDWDDMIASEAEIRTPAAWVVFAGWNRTSRTTDDELIVEGASFGLMMADENMRPGEQYQRHGGPDPAIEPGSYRLIEAAVASLAGQSFGFLRRPLEAGPLRPVRQSDATKKRRLSMFACEFTCDYPLVIAPDGEIDDLEALHVNWDIPAIGDPEPVDNDPIAPGNQLPDDGHADATDHLELET